MKRRAESTSPSTASIWRIARRFDAPMLTEEDDREAYGEQRLKSLCWLNGRVAVLVWTDRESGPHLISCRYGDKHETQTYIKVFL